MDAMVAFITPDFHNSKWTDQEVGVAFGNNVPIIPINLGRNPYGFIGKYQELPGREKSATVLAKEVYEVLWTKRHLKDLLIETLVTAFENATSFEQANNLMEFVGKIDNAPPKIIERLEKATEENDNVKRGFTVIKLLPSVLKRLRQKKDDLL